MREPSHPDGLSDRALQIWADFWASDVAKRVDLKSDLPRLVRWIQQTDEYDSVVNEVGLDRVVPGSTGNYVLNPLLKYLGQLDTQLARTENEFGMTPAGREKLTKTAVDDDKPADGFDELMERRHQKAAGA